MNFIQVVSLLAVAYAANNNLNLTVDYDIIDSIVGNQPEVIILPSVEIYGRISYNLSNDGDDGDHEKYIPIQRTPGYTLKSKTVNPTIPRTDEGANN